MRTKNQPRTFGWQKGLLRPFFVGRPRLLPASCVLNVYPSDRVQRFRCATITWAESSAWWPSSVSVSAGATGKGPATIDCNGCYDSKRNRMYMGTYSPFVANKETKDKVFI